MTPLEAIADEFSLELIVLFGSRATGVARADSDTDIAVRGARVLSPDEFLSVARRLDSLYQNVDLVDLRRASPLLLGAIGADAKVLFQRHSHLFEEFRTFAWNQFLDFKPYFDISRARNKSEIEGL